jgi:hypothetical protein
MYSDYPFGIFKLFLGNRDWTLRWMTHQFKKTRKVHRVKYACKTFPWWEEQTTQWPKEKVQKELMYSGRVNSFCSTSDTHDHRLHCTTYSQNASVSIMLPYSYSSWRFKCHKVLLINSWLRMEIVDQQTLTSSKSGEQWMNLIWFNTTLKFRFVYKTIPKQWNR